MSVSCDRTGCFHLAFWRPVIVMHLMPPRVAVLPGIELDERHTTPARAVLDLNLCSGHRQVLTLHELVSDDAWRGLQAGLRAAGLPAPDRARLELEWEKLAC
jgi:hypothetical protein